MARYNTNRYQYETSPRKLQPEYTPIKKKYPKKSTASKKEINIKTQKKAEVKSNSKIVLYIGVIFVILFHPFHILFYIFSSSFHFYYDDCNLDFYFYYNYHYYVDFYFFFFFDDNNYPL